MPSSVLDDSQHKNRPIILVIDDTAVNRMLCQKVLQSDHMVITAESGLAGLELARETPPDLILLDIMMPGMDGYETMHALKADPLLSEIPVIFLTASIDEDMQIKALQMGAHDFINKPFNNTIFRHRIDNTLERKRLYRKALDQGQRLEKALSSERFLSAQLESAFNATNDSLIVTDVNLEIIRINNNTHRMLGSQIGKSLSAFRLERLDGEELALHQLSWHDGPIEGYLHCPEGQKLAVAITRNPFQTDLNKNNFLWSIQDIKVRLTLEESNRRTLKTLEKTILELTTQKKAMDEHCLVSITDIRGLITYANSHFCRISGYSQDELLGRTHNIIKSNLHPASFFDEMWSTISSGKIWHGEITNRKRSGELYWVDSTIVPWLDESGKPFQYVAIRTEITSRIKAERAVTSARQREIEIGAEIQKRLLFGSPPGDINGLSISSYTEASQGIDGDFYTFTKIGPKVFEILTGDVMGKGVAAAMVGAGIKSTYRRVVLEYMAENKDGRYPSAANVVNMIHKSTTPDLIELDTFATLSLLRFDREKMTLTWVNAGHAPSLLIAADGQQITKLAGDNLPLGIMANEVYEEQTLEIGIGDSTIVYSDGISESMNPEGNFYGEERILSIMRLGQQLGLPPSVLLHSLRSDLDDFCDSKPGHDDRTAVIIQVRPLRSNKRGSIKDRRAPSTSSYRVNSINSAGFVSALPCSLRINRMTIFSH